MHINDAILQATGGATINEGLASWFSKTADESLQDAEARWLFSHPRVTELTTLNDMWYQFLSGTGHIDDLKLQYWTAAIGGFLAPVFIGTISDVVATQNVLITPIETAQHFIGGAVVTYSADQLPSGLNIDGVTGIITGTPLVVNDTAVVITATNANGSDNSNSFNISVEA